MAWKAVLDNASAQETAAKVLAASQSRTIEDFYPELHGPEIGGGFANTTGSHLIGDILTSPHVLLDLYDDPRQESLIRRYGADIDFILKLRNEGHITICANLPPERYETTEWLHGILADHRTIFRSVRTPWYFQSQSRDFMNIKNEREGRLSSWLSRRPSSEIDNLCDLMLAAHRPDSAAVLAQVLALWFTQIQSVLDPDAVNELVAEFEDKPDDAMRQLRQVRFLAVSPASAGLGGVLRAPIGQIRSLFPDTDLRDIVPEGDFARLNNINEYLVRKSTHLSTSDLTNERYWNEQLTQFRRDALWDVIADKSFRLQAMRAEQTLRVELAKMGSEDISLAAIDDYIEHVEKQRQWVSSSIDLAYTASMAVLLFCGYRYVGAAGLAARALGNQMVRNITRQIAEIAFPKLQVVNFVNRAKRRHGRL